MALIAGHQNKKNEVLGWLTATGLLGLTFLTMEVMEFSHLISEGHTPQTSAFLSAFFTLIGAHGLHILAGVTWLVILIVFIQKRGLSFKNLSNLLRFGTFWHLLDLVWIFIFTIVYLVK